LCAWVAYTVAGASFSKLSEQFDAAVPAGSRGLPWGAFRAVQIIAVLAAILVAAGVCVAIPALVRFVRAGGWADIQVHVRRATIATIVGITASIGLVAWAHALSSSQRNGGDSVYGVAFGAWAVLVIATLGLWSAVAVVAGRLLELTPPVLAIETVIAAALTAAMTAMTAATAIWWAAMAVDAPWFLHGTRSGSAGSGFEPRLALTMALMLTAVTAALYGTIRATRAWNLLRHG
jgi:hypothetical protein